ncbi:MAG: preprotein translocase subunit SecA, partial [Sediminibacterium sp.]|nr:preprotein translocase subunit SecA [Sediminibacterium sp.]
MFNFLNKLFGGDKSQKDVKKLQPQVDAINDFFNQYEQLSNDELRQNTTLFKTRIAEALSEIDAEIVNINESIKSLPSEDLAQMEATYEQLDNLQQERLKQLEIVLEEILPEAFATIKEAARRFSASSEIISQATEMDKALAISKNYVSIKNNQAIFKNTWVAAGSTVVWNMVHYDVQLVGGIALHQGKISEMSTGEGKTLVSTLPAYLNALSGKGVHIVTVNDYLARRDSEWNGPLLEWLGITVDCIDKYDPHSEKRHQAYLADITYGTNNEFGFDYLRDNMVIHATDKVQRKHHFAMVDEVDSVLIDDARTPLIISGPISHASNEQQFFEFKPLIETLLEAQRKIFQFSLQEAKRLIAAGIDDPKESGFHLFRAFRGLPKNTALIKFLSETNVRQKLQKAENYYLSDQQKEMHKIDADLYFYIDEKNNSIELTDKGLHLIGQKTSNPNFFTIPDLGIEFGKLEQQTELTPAEIKQKKEVLMTEYSVKAENIHCVNQLLKAFTLFEKDVDYIVLNEQIKIIDEQTGRILEGRRYSDGLHQALEAKENVKIEASTQTYATITLQNYFRMYHKVAGMTGTAETEAQEFWDIYKLDVMKIPTNVPMIRIDQNDQIFKTKREKYKAIIEYVQKLSEKGQPILIGTTSVEVSELLSKILSQSKIKHNVLNAKQHAREAQVIAEAGLKNAVTIATNMAGRGTDIKLGEGVKEIGGLAILGTEKHESRRVDRQLRGRSGRQGDPGSTLFMMSLEDNLIRMFGGERIAKVADFAGFKEGEVIEHKLITNAIERAQKKVEENNYGIRKRLLEYDDVMNKQRNVIYKKRDAALFGERIKLDIDNAFYLVATLLIQKHLVNKNYNEFILEVILNFEFEINKTISQTHFENEDENILIQKLYQAAIH